MKQWFKVKGALPANTGIGSGTMEVYYHMTQENAIAFANEQNLLLQQVDDGLDPWLTNLAGSESNEVRVMARKNLDILSLES